MFIKEIVHLVDVNIPTEIVKYNILSKTANLKWSKLSYRFSKN